MGDDSANSVSQKGVAGALIRHWDSAFKGVDFSSRTAVANGLFFATTFNYRLSR